MISSILKIESDGLLYSYLLRLTYVNAFSSLQEFALTYVYPENTFLQYIYVPYDVRFDLYNLLREMTTGHWK